jgi:hypothetical protein
MRRLLLTGALVVTALGLSLTTAFADSGSSNGKGTDVTHYNVTYVWSGAQSVNCIGVHQIGKNFPGTPGTTGTGGQDSFTCTTTDGQPFSAYITAGETLTQPFAGVGWLSDYNGALATSFAGIVSADGTSFTAEAGYY